MTVLDLRPASAVSPAISAMAEARTLIEEALTLADPTKGNDQKAALEQLGKAHALIDDSCTEAVVLIAIRGIVHLWGGGLQLAQDHLVKAMRRTYGCKLNDQAGLYRYIGTWLTHVNRVCNRQQPSPISV